MEWHTRLQRWLLEPHPTVQDPVQRQRAAILSLFLLAMPPIYLLFEYVAHVSEEGMPQLFGSSLLWLLTVEGVLLLLYGLSRTRHQTLTARLVMVFAVVVIWVRHIALAPALDETPLIYYALLIFAAGFVCSRRETLMAIGLVYVALASLLFLPQPAIGERLHLVLHVGIFVTMATILTLGAHSVTALLQSQRAEAEERLSGLLNASGEAILVLRKGTYEILETNQVARSLLQTISDELVGKSFVELLTNDARAKVSGYWEIADGTPHILTIAQPDSAPLYVEARLSAYPAREGQAYVLSLMDATEKLHTYQALASSEQRFYEVFNRLYPFMMLLDEEGRVLEANAVAQKRLRLPLSAIVERHLWSFEGLDATAGNTLQSLLQEALAGGLAQGEVTFQVQEGEHCIFDCTIQPLQTESRASRVLILVARDVTEEKQLQQRLYDIERRYDALFHRSEEAIFLFDTKGIIIAANEQAATFLDTEAHDILGSDMTRFIAPDEIPEARRRVQDLLSGKRIPVYRRIFLTAAGMRVVGEVSVTSVYGKDGTLRYFQSMVRDASQREEREQMRLQYRLMRARNQMMSEFITAASHHFRTPLTTIKASLYLLPRLQEHPEKHSEHLGILNAEVERLERLLNDLLLVVRLQRTATEEYQVNIMLSTLVYDLRSRQRVRADYDAHRWSWHISESREPIQGNGEYIDRAMQNLLDNAVAYTPEGGTITVSVFEQDQWAVFEVLDTGIGIADEDIPRIGRDFFRADDAQERQHANTGLGLSIVRQIMLRHNGTMLLESRSGQGTRVQLIWPTVDDWLAIQQELPTEMLGDPSPFADAQTQENP